MTEPTAGAASSVPSAGTSPIGAPAGPPDGEPAWIAQALRPPPPEDHVQAAFSGRRGALFKLLVKNMVLTLLTLGVYRFWAKTWVRRYFWSNTRLLNAPLEYTGTPVELLLGFLIVLVIMVPLGLAYAGLEFLAPTLSWPATVAGYGAYFLIVFLLVQIGFYRMWRYRLTRTVWRGIRFGLDGSAWAYLGRAALWMLATAGTLWVAAPWASMALTRYRMEHSRYGTGRFAFDGNGGGLIKRWLVVLVLAGLPVVLVLSSGAAGYLSVLDALKSDDPEGTARAMGQVMGPAMASFSLYAFLPFALVWYRVSEARYVLNHTTFDGARLSSTLSTGSVLWLLVKVYLLYMVLFTVVGGLFGVVITLVVIGLAKSSAATVDAQAQAALVGNAVGFVVVLVFMAGMSLIQTGILQFGLVKRLCATLTIDDPAVFDRVTQATGTGPGYGEGLADAFDIGAV
ncbi:MAG: DUF898 domain-containing protein [Rhodobacterales bacterium]|nr:DUF898 domain-containing protein [Rhodobacterales bacterium]